MNSEGRILIPGQVWKNSSRKRTIVEARGFSVGYYSGDNRDKITRIPPWTFIHWIRQSCAEEVKP